MARRKESVRGLRVGAVWRHYRRSHRVTLLRVDEQADVVEFRWNDTKEVGDQPPQSSAIAAFLLRYGWMGAKPARHGLPWSKAEDAILAREFTDCNQRTLMRKLPGRSWARIRKRATETLGLTSAPQELIPLKAAARRLGYNSETVRTICRHAKVKIRRSPRPQSEGASRWFVAWDEVEAAVAWWVRSETVNGAATSRGLPPYAFERWTRSAGIRLPYGGRLPFAYFDLVLKMRGWFSGCELLAHAARRHGFNGPRFKRLLQNAGMGGLAAKGTNHAVYVHPGAVDRVVALWRRREARKTAEARCGRVVQEAAPRTSAETTTTCATPPSCSPVSRTKSPRQATVNRTGVLPAGTMTTAGSGTDTSAVTTSLPP